MSGDCKCMFFVMSRDDYRPNRLNFPEEKEIDWLSLLLDAYFIADKGVYEAISKRIRGGESLACGRGCSSCCNTHTTIPIYPLELVGIYWYAIEKVSGPARDSLKRRLREFKKGEGCPFLIDGICIIHPMRPLACRHFNVFNRPCAPGEDPYYTRRKDVLTPNEKAKNKALAAMLPFHGIRDRVRRKQAIRDGLLNSLVKNLHDIEWASLALRMDGRSPRP